MKPHLVTEAVIAAMRQSTNDAILGRPCRCSGAHTPSTDCYLPPGWIKAFHNRRPNKSGGGHRMTTDQTAEQQARDMLERAGIETAQSMTAGDLVEVANLIVEIDVLKARIAELELDISLRDGDAQEERD